MQIPQITPKTLNYLFWIALAGFILSVIVNVSTFLGIEVLYNRLFIILLGTGFAIGVWGTILVEIVRFLRRQPRSDFSRPAWNYVPLWMKLLLFASAVYMIVGGFAFISLIFPFGNLVQQNSQCFIQNGDTIVKELSSQECQQRIMGEARLNSVVDILFYYFCVVLLYSKRVKENRSSASRFQAETRIR